MAKLTDNWVKMMYNKYDVRMCKQTSTMTVSQLNSLQFIIILYYIQLNSLIHIFWCT